MPPYILYPVAVQSTTYFVYRSIYTTANSVLPDTPLSRIIKNRLYLREISQNSAIFGAGADQRLCSIITFPSKSIQRKQPSSSVIYPWWLPSFGIETEPGFIYVYVSCSVHFGT